MEVRVGKPSEHVCVCVCVCRLDVCYSWLYMLRVSRTYRRGCVRCLFRCCGFGLWFVERALRSGKLVVGGDCQGTMVLRGLLMSGASPFVVGVPVDGIPSSVRPFVSTRGRDDGRTTGPRRGGGGRRLTPATPDQHSYCGTDALAGQNREQKNWNYQKRPSNKRSSKPITTKLR